MKDLRPMVGVARKDRAMNEEIRRMAGIEELLAEKVDNRVLQRIWHVKKMDEERFPKKVRAATV